jgi:hypothetical protein
MYLAQSNIKGHQCNQQEDIKLAKDLKCSQYQKYKTIAIFQLTSQLPKKSKPPTLLAH